MQQSSGEVLRLGATLILPWPPSDEKQCVADFHEIKRFQRCQESWLLLRQRRGHARVAQYNDRQQRPVTIRDGGQLCDIIQSHNSGGAVNLGSQLPAAA